MKYFLALSFCWLLLACGTTVNVDYDKETDFSSLNSYDFYNDIASGLNDLDENRIIAAIENTMSQRGFVRESDNSFLINFYTNESISNSRNTIGIGIGGGGGNVGVGVSGGIPIGGRTINQKLTIDIIENKDDERLVWQGALEGTLREKASPQEKEKFYKEMVEKILKNFPPDQK